MSHDIIVTLMLPAEFAALCRADQVEPGTVLRGFVADLCQLAYADAGYLCNGAWAHELARRYYEQVGYAGWPR